MKLSVNYSKMFLTSIITSHYIQQLGRKVIVLNKQIYGFKKSKAFGLCSVVVASYLLFSGVASADEVPSATATEINTEAAQPTTAFKVSDNQVLDAEKAVDSKKLRLQMYKMTLITLMKQ